MKKIKWYGYTFILFVLFMYIMGIYDFFMMLSHNSEYYLSHNYGKEVIEYFTNYPIYFMIFWIVNLLTGFISPLLLTLKKRLSKYLALVSSISQLILLLLTFAFRNRLEVLGLNIAIFDIFILLMTFGFYIYCKYIFKVKEDK